MPARKGRLRDPDIGDVMAWYQALWLSDIYSCWRKDNAAGAAPKG